ncbi:hypothetical protein EJ110_NYTH27980 [Nymphaea thermarum]|nr:hypothetical protein EJ110_NYTH27980 [Nymphaea thermarum]
MVLAEELENSSSVHGFYGGDDQKKCVVCMCRLKEGEEGQAFTDRDFARSTGARLQDQKNNQKKGN